MAVLLCGSAPAAADPFTIAILPDTQHYTDSAVNAVHFEEQTQWIVDNQAAEVIVFTTQLGDVVEHGAQGPGANQVEWDRALVAFDVLHDDPTDPPYSAVAGNHDYDVTSDKSTALQYLVNLGPPRYTSKPWFAGFAANQLNMAQVFAGSGHAFLHVGLEWLPSDHAIEFAQAIITANPMIPVIVSTHEHLDRGNPAPWRPGGATPDTSGDNDAEQVYRKLVEPFPQVFLVLSGHQFGNGRRSFTTPLGRTVHGVMTDYQNDPNGGNGWMQLARFRPADAEIDFETFSPSYVSGATAGPDRSIDPDGNFTLAYDLEELLDMLATNVVLHFRQGQDAGFGAYTGAVDTYVGNGPAVPPDVANGDLPVVRMDANNGPWQGLLRFDGLVGTELGQVPAGTSIDQAILTLTIEGNSAEGDGGALHRMRVPWADSTTWNQLGGGVTLGSQAETVPDANTGPAAKGTWSYDVTASVQAWADGEPNHGWVFLANGDVRWKFRSSDWSSPVERPMLTIVYAGTPPPPPPSSCGLGPELAGLLAALMWARTRSRRASDR